MSNETKTLALFEEGNPIPDLDALEPISVDATAYLATLRARSSNVTQVEEKIDKKAPKRLPNWALLAAAAFLVVVAGVALILLSQGNEEAPVVTEPTPTTAGLIGTWQSGAVTVALEEESYALIVDGVLVDVGTYATDVDPLDVIVFNSSEESPGCGPGDEGQMFYETGEQLLLRPKDDSCFIRALLTGETGGMSPVASIDVNQLPTAFDLTGSWGTVDTRAVFEGDSYTLVVNGAVVDSGAYEVLRSPYRLALSPDTSDETCGDVIYGFSLQSGEILILEAPEDETCMDRMAIAFRELPPLEG